MSERQDHVRQRVIDGRASPEEVQGFIVELERALESALEAVDNFSTEAASATNRLARHMEAAADLTRMLPMIAAEDDRLTRLTLAEEAIDLHEASVGE